MSVGSLVTKSIYEMNTEIMCEKKRGSKKNSEKAYAERGETPPSKCDWLMQKQGNNILSYFCENLILGWMDANHTSK